MSTTAGLKFQTSNKIHYIQMPNVSIHENDKVVVTTTRGKEMAVVEKINVETKDSELSTFVTQFERVATQHDLEREQEFLEKRATVLETANQVVVKCKLKMKLVDAEFTIDGQKVIISFVCDDRVDFRELVKELASVLKLRIELKQIGTRDQAKLVGGIGSCGQECCCIRYLNDFDKVSVKMAKTQNLSLNPVKISGVCGRLMCCLAYENDHYAETMQKMPKLGSKVTTPSGMGTVMYNNLLKEISSVRLDGDDYKYVNFPLSDLKFEKQNSNVPPCQAKQNCKVSENVETNDNNKANEVPISEKQNDTQQ